MGDPTKTYKRKKRVKTFVVDDLTCNNVGVALNRAKDTRGMDAHNSSDQIRRRGIMINSTIHGYDTAIQPHVSELDPPSTTTPDPIIITIQGITVSMTSVHDVAELINKIRT